MHQYKVIDIGGGNSGRACGGRAVIKQLAEPALESYAPAESAPRTP